MYMYVTDLVGCPLIVNSIQGRQVYALLLWMTRARTNKETNSM